jgi:predicted methyltransferase
VQPYYQDDAVTLYHGRAEDVLPALPAASVDLLFTDPPYPREFLDCYATLGREAPRVCKPGAFVFAYLGAETLPEVMDRLRAHGLRWFWLFDIKHNRGAPRVWAKRLMVTAKPVLCFTNGPVSQEALRWAATSHDSESRGNSLP